jgi:hypothetical protein
LLFKQKTIVGYCLPVNYPLNMDAGQLYRLVTRVSPFGPVAALLWRLVPFLPHTS